VEIIISREELITLVARALGAEVHDIVFNSEGKVVISTSLNLLGLALAPSNPPISPMPTSPSPLSPPVVSNSYPEATPEEMAKLLEESRGLTGVVYEYTQDGDVITRDRNEDESNIPPGEDIIYVRNNHE